MVESFEVKNDDDREENHGDSDGYHKVKDYNRFNGFQSMGIPSMLEEELDGNQVNTHRER